LGKYKEEKVMGDISASNVIESYKNMVKELGKSLDPGHKAAVVYGGYMGKSYHTHEILKSIGLDACYPEVVLPYNNLRKDWIYNMIKSSKRNLPLIIFDSYWFPYTSCKKEIPEYNELIKSISENKFGFTISDPCKYGNEIIPEGFFEIKSNLIFLIGYSLPDDLINIMPSFDFNFNGRQLLTYIRENIDTIFPELDILTHEMRLEMLDILNIAYEKGVYETFDFKWIKNAFFERYAFENGKKENKTLEDFYKDFEAYLSLIKEGKIK
jgi:hypothetical protein